MKKGVFLTILVALLSTSACQSSRCQPPAETSFKYLSQAKWRLVDTTDSQFAADLDNYNFQIWSFQNNMTGGISKVENNQEIKEPIASFTWSVDAGSGNLGMRFSSLSEETVPLESAGLIVYTYQLGRELELRSNRGRSYWFVPFTGIVEPDNYTCTFR